ncbi:MAG TPA: SIS domain-containing protein, partial [Ktedonobacteraceae bacterium]|nr:SIS domain-containing protein [Ktedonobacteraceae bacterium]
MSYLAKKEEVFLGQSERSEVGLDYYNSIENALSYQRKMLDRALNQSLRHVAILAEVTARLIETLRSGHKVLIAGNGGSAAEAQHFAAELVGRFKRERSPYAVLSLTTDTSILTAIANDYGYQDIFARQILALGQPRDMLIVFSTSGESENLLYAATAARRCMMTIIAITGD